MIDEMALLQAQYPKVIFSHETALYVHELTEKNQCLYQLLFQVGTIHPH